MMIVMLFPNTIYVASLATKLSLQPSADSGFHHKMMSGIDLIERMRPTINIFHYSHPVKHLLVLKKVLNAIQS